MERPHYSGLQVPATVAFSARVPRLCAGGRPDLAESDKPALGPYIGATAGERCLVSKTVENEAESVTLFSRRLVPIVLDCV
jgi:hypothetical protein